jgi:inner membrane protein
MPWWVWALGGIGLLMIEVVAPGGLFALFFGIGALVTAALAGLELAGPAWTQWLIFAALSVVLLGFLRRRMRGALAPTDARFDTLVGETAVLLSDLPSRGVARAELRGASWEARSSVETRLAQGQRCRVERVEGLTLWLVPEDSGSR